jgi:ribonuclease-3
LFQRYPEKTEGELSKLRASLVCEYTLSQITRALGFGDYLYLSHGELHTGGRERSSILCDLFESVLGAIYLDGGLKPAADYINRFLLTDIEQKTLFFDAKSRLQEYAQKNNCTLSYELLSETGPEHNKLYQVQVILDGKAYATGTGTTKKAADQVAAHSTLLSLHYGT